VQKWWQHEDRAINEKIASDKLEIKGGEIGQFIGFVEEEGVEREK